MRTVSCCKVPVAHHGALGASNCNKVRSAILTSFLILLMMRLSCSEKFSALSSAFARICSACCNWQQNHLMSFDTLFIFPIYLFVSMPRRYERVGIYGNFFIFLMFFAHL